MEGWPLHDGRPGNTSEIMNDLFNKFILTNIPQQHRIVQAAISSGQWAVGILVTANRILATAWCRRWSVVGGRSTGGIMRDVEILTDLVEKLAGDVCAEV